MKTQGEMSSTHSSEGFYCFSVTNSKQFFFGNFFVFGSGGVCRLVLPLCRELRQSFWGRLAQQPSAPFRDFGMVFRDFLKERVPTLPPLPFVCAVHFNIYFDGSFMSQKWWANAEMMTVTLPEFIEFLFSVVVWPPNPKPGGGRYKLPCLFLCMMKILETQIFSAFWKPLCKSVLFCIFVVFRVE